MKVIVGRGFCTKGGCPGVDVGVCILGHQVEAMRPRRQNSGEMFMTKSYGISLVFLGGVGIVAVGHFSAK